MTPTSQRGSRALCIAFAAVCAAWWLHKLGWTPPVGQWDFRVYYFGAQAWRAGLDPYDPRVLPAELFGTGFKFNYPPYALALFSPLTHLSVVHAMQIFLVVKLAALAWLLTIWSRLLRTGIADPLWIVFLLFAYSSAIFVDVISGSVTTFEQLLVWLGVGALLDRRYGAFAAAIVVASLFRLTPIALLVAALVLPDRRGIRSVAAGLASAAAIAVTTALVAPQLTRGFLRSLPTNFGERGWLNPAALPLADDLSAMIAQARHVAPSPTLALAIYGAIVAAVAVPTIATVRRIARQADAPHDALIYFVFVATALVLPRFKNYSYMLLTVPTYYIATHSVQLRRAIPLVVIACLPIYSWIATPDHLTFVADYSKWFIALGAWALFLYELPCGSEVVPQRA